MEEDKVQRLRVINARIHGIEEEMRALGVSTSYVCQFFQGANAHLFKQDVPVDYYHMLPHGYMPKEKFESDRSDYNKAIEMYRTTLGMELINIEKCSAESKLNTEMGHTISPLNQAALWASRDKVKTAIHGLSQAQHGLYQLYQKVPIDSQEFYATLTPKLNEMLELCNERADIASTLSAVKWVFNDCRMAKLNVPEE